VVFEKQYTPTPQRRPNGHVRKGSTKKGNKKRGLRARLVGLLDEVDRFEDDDEEDSRSRDGRPPAMADLRTATSARIVTVGQVRWPSRSVRI
jgi:hypothetical protein